MTPFPEDTDQIGSFYKSKFEEHAAIPDNDIKSSLFERMDMLEGKRPKTVYLHFNLFGMKIAASITMVIVSSLALMAVAAVTVIAVKNNQAKMKPEIIPVEIQQKSKPSGKQEISKQPASSLTTKKTEQSDNSNKQDLPETIMEESKVKSEEVKEIQSPVKKSINKNGDNSNLLNELDDEDSLFMK